MDTQNKNNTDIADTGEEPQDISEILNQPINASLPASETPYLGKKSSKLLDIWDKFKWILLGVGMLVAILLSFIFVAQPFQVSGESMTPTLQDGETMLTLKLPKTWANLSNSQYIPARWRVVIVQSEGALGPENFVKRVIALPGERVVIRDGKITIYNVENPDGFNPDEHECCKSLAATAGNIDAVVKEGHVFVVGDNREFGGSIDSRSGLGAIPADQIVGQVTHRIWPISSFRTL